MHISQYISETGSSDAKFGEEMEPKVSAVTVWRWRTGRLVPKRHYILQIKEKSGGKVQASDFYQESSAKEDVA